jgi:hypothetical protein
MSPAGSSNAPEARARARIDQALTDGGWTLQDRDDMNPGDSGTLSQSDRLQSNPRDSHPRRIRLKPDESWAQQLRQWVQFEGTCDVIHSD